MYTCDDMVNTLTDYKDFIESCNFIKLLDRTIDKLPVLLRNIVSIDKYTFAYCKNLKTVHLPNCVTSIGEYAFMGCDGVKDLLIPSSVTSVGSAAFSGCCMGDYYYHGENVRAVYEGTIEEFFAISGKEFFPTITTSKEFEKNAVVGIPTVPENLGWSSLDMMKGGRIHVCGILNADASGSLPVWFSSDADNTVWAKLRLLDADGNVLGETGILKPGEYVERMQLVEGAHSCICRLIMTLYEPETYYVQRSSVMTTNIMVP